LVVNTLILFYYFCYNFVIEMDSCGIHTFIKIAIIARLSRRSNARQFCNFPRARSARLTATMRGCEMSGSDNREPL